MEVTRLVCSCGEALSVTYSEGEWVLGHFEEMCGYLIRHSDFAKVIEKFRELQAINA